MGNFFSQNARLNGHARLKTGNLATLHLGGGVGQGACLHLGDQCLIHQHGRLEVQVGEEEPGGALHQPPHPRALARLGDTILMLLFDIFVCLFWMSLTVLKSMCKVAPTL